MKKLLKNLAILTVFACGLFTGCNNDAEEIDLNVNVTVSTDTPSLDEPKPLAYGVLLTWRVTQDDNHFRVTRQAKGGEEKSIGYVEGENRYLDSVGFNNVLEEGVEYTYRVYNLGGDNYDTADGVVKYSYAEKKITLAEGSLKKQGDQLDAVKEDDVKISFKNYRLTINYLNDENFVWTHKFVVRDAETGRKIEYGHIKRLGIDGYDAQKINVEITNVSKDGYYADSDVMTIKDIENTVTEEIYISDLKATVRDKTVVLLWTTEEKVEVGEFTIQRTKCTVEYKYDSEYGDYRDVYTPIEKPEVLKITPTYEEKYDGTYYWKAVDETAEVGTNYKYEVITDFYSSNNYKLPYADVSVPGNIVFTDVRYSTVDNAVTLTWKATNGISDFKIYRADKDLSGPDWGGDYESEYYDLYKPLNIQVDKVESTGNDEVIYTAKDTTVEKNKDYTYRVTSADGLDCSHNKAVSTGETPYVSGYISLYVSTSSINTKEYDILLSFDGNKNVTYKGYYTTVDNKGNESARTSFDFTKDNDWHYRKAFKASASAITGLDKAVSVNFYVRCYDGDKLLSHWEYDYSEERYVEKYEYTKALKVDPSLTTYTSLSEIGAYQDGSKKQITIYVSGYNFKDVVKVTYFKNDEEVKTPKSALTWTEVTDTDPYYDYDYDYKATLAVDEYGYYTICATIPEDNAYPSDDDNNYSYKTDSTSVN